MILEDVWSETERTRCLEWRDNIPAAPPRALADEKAPNSVAARGRPSKTTMTLGCDVRYVTRLPSDNAALFRNSKLLAVTEMMSTQILPLSWPSHMVLNITSHDLGKIGPASSVATYQ